jgi:hypothetical protein
LRPWTLIAAVALACQLASAQEGARVVRVRNVEELTKALAAAKPGTRIEIAPGEYAGGLSFAGLAGDAGRPVVLAGEDPKRPPVFRGGGAGLHLTDPAHVELRDLAFEGQSGNGLNIDDGGTFERPARHVVLSGLVVKDVGPKGNCDGIKLSGVADFRVEGCTVERWGSGGSAIDMVGCHEGTIERCVFRHAPDALGASGVQAKGGSRGVTIRRCRFEHAGGRAVNAGGSTGLEYFRPPLADWSGERFEAKDVVVEGCTLIGSQAPIAAVGAEGVVVRFNTIHLPGRWAMRILQETRAEGFVPSRDGVFEDNVVVFRSTSWSEGGFNRGAGTSPETFRFARNAWFCEDAPERTRELVKLPTPEKDGVYGKDPGFRDAAKGDLRVRPDGPAAKAGADALPGR